MRRMALVAMMAAFSASAWAAAPADTGSDKVDPAALEKTIADAPGPTNCYQNTTGDRLIACENREKGISAFKKLYEIDKARALVAIKKRFDEIPSPKGGYFPILASVQVKDASLVPMLKKVATAQKENDLGLFASEAARVIETGKCSKLPPPKKLQEICE